MSIATRLRSTKADRKVVTIQIGAAVQTKRARRSMLSYSGSQYGE